MVRRNRRRSRGKRSKAPFWIAAVALAALVGLMTSCPQKGKDGEDPKKAQASDEDKEDEDEEDRALADIPLDPKIPEDRTKLPQTPAETPERIAAYYILVKYKGAKDASKAKWGKEDAGRRAQRLMRLATRKGADFLALARKYSEAPEAERDHQIFLNRGSVGKGFERFEKAAFGMKIGQVSDAILTPNGFYVMSRADPAEYSTSHVLVQYKGSLKAPVAITRTKEEAKTRADKILGYALKKGANFAVLVGRYTDSPSRIRGGVIRPIRPGVNEKGEEVAITENGSVNPALASYAKAVAKLKVGEISPVVETPYGFHVIKRIKISWIRASHILVAYTDGGVEPQEERKKSQAKQLAKELRKKARRKNADFAALAKEHSDDLKTAEKGGDLGLFARGMKVPRLELKAFTLRKGQVSNVLETQYGFHVILRTK